MEKLTFLMTRKPGLTRPEFFDHYLEMHTLLGMRVCLLMSGYTVNLIDPGNETHPGPDTVTEVWTPDVSGFFDPERAFRNESERMELALDDRSFIGDRVSFVVEEVLVHGEWPRGEVRRRTPGVKRISLHTGGNVPPAGSGVEFMVVDRVVRRLEPEAEDDVDFFVSEWAPSLDALPAITARSFLVHEYRQRMLEWT